MKVIDHALGVVKSAQAISGPGDRVIVKVIDPVGQQLVVSLEGEGGGESLDPCLYTAELLRDFTPPGEWSVFVSTITPEGLQRGFLAARTKEEVFTNEGEAPAEWFISPLERIE